MSFFVRQYRNTLPTNPDWLAMTQEDIIREYWQIHYFELRKAGVSEGEDATQFEGSVEFEKEMADHGLVQVGGKWIEVNPDEIE